MLKTADHDESDSEWRCFLNSEITDTARAIYYFTRVISRIAV